MATVVVDTDVVSFLFKRDTRAELYRPHLEGQILILSFMTVAELDRWALEHNWGMARRSRMQAYMQQFEIHPFDRELCLMWAEVSDGARRNGRPIECADAWIAATAIFQGVPLVSHNRRHYTGVDRLEVISASA